MPSQTNTSHRRHFLSCSRKGLGIAALSMMVWLLFGMGQTFAQSYNINSVNGTTVTTASGSFYDSGGSSSSYNSSETYTVTFKSGSADKLRFNFSSFSTESGFDFLYIYDGPSVSSPQVSGSPFSGTTSPGIITSTSSSLTFKFVSDASLTSSGWAAAISTVAASDYGDYSGFGAASTTVSNSLFMGTAVTDVEASNPANSTATGDPDDEDLTQPALIAGATASLSVPVFNNTGSNAYLSIWIDYNNNGVLTNTGEQVVNNLTVSSNAVAQTLVLSVAVPSTATTGTPLGIRYRLDSISGTASTGIGGIGEVEDYLVTISPPTLDYGDFSGFGNAASTANSNLRLGFLTDAEGTPVKNSAATGDDITGSDDEDGIVIPAFLTAGLGGAFTGTVTNNTGANAYLNAWIDFNNNGSLTDAGEQIVTNSVVPTGLTNYSGQITFTVPSNATTTTVGVRFRLSSTISPGPTGTSGTGEVEDYVVPIQPSMSIGNSVWNDINNNGIKDAGELGVGGASVQLYSSGADNTVNTADDVLTATTTTGVSGSYLFSGLASGKYYVKVTPPTAYPVTSGTPATTDNDVDNNNDGSQPGGAGTALYSPIITLTANAESVADGDTDANTNLTVDFGLFTGFTVGNLVFTDTNNNGVLDAGETGISGLTVELLNSAGASFSPAVTTTTNASGAYSFTVYTAGTYKVKVTPNATYPVASSTVGTDNGTDGNNDGTQAGAQGTPSTSFAFTLSPGGEPGTSGTTSVENTIDFGFRGCPTITITPTTLAAGVVATVYTQATAFAASNGTAPYSWSVSGLPAGMSWDSTNLKIIGTPLFTGTSSVLLSVTDAKGCVGSATVPFQVCSTPSLKPDSLPAATVGAAYSTTLSATEPGFDLQQAFSSTQIGTLANADAVLAGTNRISNWTGSGAVVNFVSSGGGDGNFTGTVFPAGVGDDFAVRATGIITIPTAGAWSFGINSDDGCRLKIDGTTVFTDDTQHAAGDHFGTITLTAGTHTIDAVFFERAGGESFELFAASGTKSSFSTSFKLIGSSGGLAVARATTAFTYTVTSGSLPTGLSLNSSTGVMSGTPTVAGTYNFTISATDSVACVGSKAYTMTAACPTLTMTPAAGALNVGTVGTAYSQAMSSSGSFGTLVWNVSSGTLPDGLSISSTTGAITGTPTTVTSGSSGTSISITAQDQYGCSVTQAYTLKICPVLGFSPSTLATPVVGTAYSQTITVGNGTGPYTFSVSSGTLPSGMSLGTSGVVSGTPTSTAAKTFTVQATDANGCPGTINYTLTPVCPSITVSPSLIVVGTVGSAYSQTLSTSGGTAPYTWSLQSGTLPAGLSLAASTGVISGTPTTSNGAGTSLTFKAVDQYGCSATASYTLKICPVITVSPATLPNGTVGTAYSTTISQSGGASPVTFAITSGTLPAGLSFSSSTGVISGTPTASTGAGATFTVTATDANSCTGSVSTTLKICPVLALGPATLPVPTVGTAYSQSISASNGASPYTFAVSSGSLPTGLTLSSAGVLSGTATNTTSQTFSVQATDANGCPGTISYTLAAVCPTLALSPSTLPSGTQGVAYSQSLTATAGTAPYSWVVSSGTLPAGITLSSAGLLSGTPTTTNGAGVAITFRATDTYGCTNTVAYTFKVCPVITVSPGTLTGATVGTAYSQTITASGGATPYTYSRSSGTLPSGLNLSSAGVLSGTPTSSTSRTFTVQAQDANGCFGTLSYTLAPVCPTISITPASIASGTVGTPYSQTLAASGGNVSYTWSVQSGTLPAGLSLAPSTGVISGTPTASNGAGVSLTLKATDIYSCSATRVYTLKICPVLTLGPATLPRGTVGSSYSSSITASGGATPYTFAISSGTLPAGLTFTGSTGQITGTPSGSNGAGTVITFSATDANNCPGSFNSTLQICPVIAMAPAAFNTPVIGTPFSQSVTASNGAGPYDYSVTSGTLPAGLSLSSAGVLSGTATSTTAQTFVVTAVDANGCPATRTYTVTPVCPSITLTPATIPYGTVGSSYSQSLTATGGNAPYTWSLQSGSLPAGLSLSTGGLVSGTPATSNGAGTSLTFAATDVYGCAVTITYNLKICPIITVSPSVLPYGTVGSAYSSSVTQSGGAAPTTFAVTGGTLPPGLSLAGSTGLISGTPTTSNAAGVTVTFTATDANGCPGSVDSLFKICPVISISPATPSTPVVGFAYSQTLTSSNGAAPYTYSVLSGILPTGLSLSSSGVISGTATSTTSQSFTVQAVDVNGCPATKSYTITPVCPTVQVAPATVSAGTVGTPYSQTLTASGGTAPYTFTLQSGTLPAGLTLSSSGLISGTPTASNGAGVVVQFKATDVYGCPGTLNVFGTANYTLKICPVISITPASPLPTATLGVPYSQTLSASGGAGSYTWSVASGSLPTGMTLSAAGVISGTPTVVASFNFTARALDVNSCPGTQSYALPVECPPIAIAPATLPAGTLGIGYSQTLTASGGTAPYTWAVTGGTLPAGLSLSTGGVISGTPTATNGAGVSVTFTATDANFNACSGVQTYVMKICPVVTVSPATLPPLTVGASYSQTLTASGGAGPYVFSVFNGSLPAWASLNPNTGVISGTPTNTASSTFVIQAADINGCPGLRSYTVAPACPAITVSPSNLATPTVGTSYSATVSGGGGSAPYTYSVTAGALPAWASLNASTGAITGMPNNVTPATFTISAGDAYSCAGVRSYTLSPVCPAITVSPSTLATGTVGTAYSSVATASGGTAPYTYAITSGTLPAGLSLSAATGQISGTPSAPTSGTTGVALTLRATDALGCQGSQIVNLKVCPVITLTPASLAAGTVGLSYSQTVTATGGTAPYVYTVSSGTLPAGMSMTSGGVISGTPTTAISSNITISVTDSYGCPGSLSYTLATSCPVITITPATLAPGTQGTAYSSALSATGGNAPYTWSVSSGTLPGGISLSTAGVISGTPTASNGAGVTVTFQASDSFGCVATKAYTFKICPVISFLPSTLPSGTTGAAYNQTLTAVNGAAPFNFSIISGTLPGGLTLNGGTGVISGTPTASNGSGTSVTFQATDANSCPGTKSYVMKICPVITLAPASLPAPIVGAAYSQTISASGGAGPYSYSVNNGGLPSWASLNASTGVISGTPNSTTGATFTITAIDVNGCPGSQVYNFTPACPTTIITPGVLATGTVGVPYSQTFAAIGGSSPYSWSLASGTLPAGLTLNNAGLISGTPTASNGAGVSITVRAVDNLACVTTRTLTLKICPVITLTPATIAPFVMGSPYSQTFTASGGASPYTYAVTSGALPAWATLNATTGVLSGTPDSNTAATFTITASDLNGCPGVRSYTMALLSLKVGNLVWSDTNNNGIKEPGENGVSNLKLELWSAGLNGIEQNGGGDDVKIAADVTTDTNGGYLFTGVPAGTNYYVRIPVLPPTNAVTAGTPVALDNGVDNDNNGLQPAGPGSSIRSPLFSISPGTEPDTGVDGDDNNGDLTIDFGLAPTISVGNLVFKDVDNSGTYDSSIDAPLDGVTLQLFAQGADPLSSTPVATTVTSGGGLYLFSVRAGNYFIYTPASQFTSTGILSGMKPARGRTDNTVPNIDDNGDQNALATSKPIATGVRTGVFTLASGVMPTSASGETGYLANSDSAYDSDANLTVDLGFYPLPTVTAPLAGRVKRDLSGSGDPTSASSPLPGVEVALYEDLNGNGKLDPEEMTAVDTQVTSSTGAYSFDAVPSGDYIVVQSILPGAEATFDSDGGDADATAITVEGDPIVEVDFMQALSPDTFSQWQQAHASADNAAGDNPDGDLASNLLEYALGTEAGSGADKRHFWLEANATGSVDAMVMRYATGHKDITYAVEGSNDLVTWFSVAATPVTISNADGTETLRYSGIMSAFVRLKVSLDANHDGSAEASATSQVQGWTRHTFSAGSQTFSMPLLKSEIFAGNATAANGAAFASGQSYYAEVIGGEGEGLRFEVDESRSTATTIAYEKAPPAAGARIAVRAHWALRELFPVALFHAGTSSSNADRVMFFNGTGYNVYWLLARPAGNRWVRDGDASLMDAGGTVVGPLEGLIVNPRASSVTVTYTGAVRSWKASAPLHAGAQLVGSGYPLVLSPNDRAMNATSGFAASDSFRLWMGDTSASTAYAAFTFNQAGALGSFWSADDGHDASGSKLFDAYRAAWIISAEGTTSWQPSLPWQP